MALLHALKEQIWILRFLTEIGYDVSDQNVIHCDSQSAIALAHNPEHHARTKHIDIQYHFVRDKVLLGELELTYKPTEEMITDVMTKAVPVFSGAERRIMVMELLLRTQFDRHFPRKGSAGELLRYGNDL